MDLTLLFVHMFGHILEGQNHTLFIIAVACTYNKKVSDISVQGLSYCYTILHDKMLAKEHYEI